ncbi:hypothetical protein EDB92DRAFT_2103665 [Lactarius akahatsu]|uniref:Uncharacterized protein n=1 Tax=Lactarius akahatsu TaxID=416441 RepID=A0AAD4LF83_9AGAM|nr:hypothetical protein EDB92DRAFT_2103665 [Lactarius akahatsu]
MTPSENGILEEKLVEDSSGHPCWCFHPLFLERPTGLWYPNDTSRSVERLAEVISERRNMMKRVGVYMSVSGYLANFVQGVNIDQRTQGVKVNSTKRENRYKQGIGDFAMFRGERTSGLECGYSRGDKPFQKEYSPDHQTMSKRASKLGGSGSDRRERHTDPKALPKSVENKVKVRRNATAEELTDFSQCGDGLLMYGEPPPTGIKITDKVGHNRLAYWKIKLSPFEILLFKRLTMGRIRWIDSDNPQNL